MSSLNKMNIPKITKQGHIYFSDNYSWVKQNDFTNFKEVQWGTRNPVETKLQKCLEYFFSNTSVNTLN